MNEHRVLITGGAGFVGSNLARKCLHLGWKVSILYQSEFGFNQINDIHPLVDLYPVSGDPDEILDIFKQAKPEIVFHLASVFHAKHTMGEIPSMIESNIGFGTLVLDAMSEVGVPFLVNTGTSWQHFDNHPYDPVNLYAATKQAFEDILAFYLETTNIQAITLKLYDTYGPNDPRPKLFSLLDSSAQKHESLDMSPGDQLIDLVYIDDVVQAYITAAYRLFEGRVKKQAIYAVSSGTPIQLKKLVDEYVRIAGVSISINWGGRPYREREVMLPWNKGKRLPGWHPRIGLAEGIRKTLEKKNGSSI